MGENLLDPGDVAEILKISKASAYSLLKQGDIPIVRIGKMVRVRREDLDKYIFENIGLVTKQETSETRFAKQIVSEAGDGSLSHGDASQKPPRQDASGAG
jgi:excisionase family DNA binding protein